MIETIETVLNDWFGKARFDAGFLGTRMSFWFQPNHKDDHQLKENYLSLTEEALAGRLTDWLATPQGRLAYILLLDQMPRCIFRGQVKAFAGDDRATALCLAGLQQRLDQQLSLCERVFFYMPLQHAEDLAAQQTGVEVYQSLETEAEGPAFKGFREYAELHRDIIQRFGRFPHRNRILGRENTDEEQEYLDQGGPRFGQG